MCRLVIAEKPSVGQAIAHVLGATERRDGYMEGGGWLVSWCVGHLVGLAPADAYDPKYSKWAYEDLPIVPGVLAVCGRPDQGKAAGRAAGADGPGGHFRRGMRHRRRAGGTAHFPAGI